MSKWNSYSITDKLAVIASFKHGESQASVSCDNGVPEWTIHGWLRDDEKLCDFVHAVDSTDSTTCHGSFQMVCEGKVGWHPD